MGSVSCFVQYCMGRPGVRSASKDAKVEDCSPKSQMLGVKRMAGNAAEQELEPQIFVEMSRQTSPDFHLDVDMSAGDVTKHDLQDLQSEVRADQEVTSAILAHALQGWQF